MVAAAGTAARAVVRHRCRLPAEGCQGEVRRPAGECPAPRGWMSRPPPATAPRPPHRSGWRSMHPWASARTVAGPVSSTGRRAVPGVGSRPSATPASAIAAVPRGQPAKLASAAQVGVQQSDQLADPAATIGRCWKAAQYLDDDRCRALCCLLNVFSTNGSVVTGDKFGGPGRVRRRAENVLDLRGLCQRMQVRGAGRSHRRLRRLARRSRACILALQPTPPTPRHAAPSPAHRPGRNPTQY